MTRIKFFSFPCLLCIFVAACAGGNAIEEGVPSAALPPAQLEPLPVPASPIVDGQEQAPTVAAAPIATPAPVLPAIPDATAPPANAMVTGGAANTGTFPNSGIERQGATEQLSDEERDRKIAELQALQEQQQANVISPETARARLLELQRLAKTHSRDTIRTIEAQ